MGMSIAFLIDASIGMLRSPVGLKVSAPKFSRTFAPAAFACPAYIDTLKDMSSGINPFFCNCLNSHSIPSSVTKNPLNPNSMLLLMSLISLSMLSDPLTLSPDIDPSGVFICLPVSQLGLGPGVRITSRSFWCASSAYSSSSSSDNRVLPITVPINLCMGISLFSFSSINAFKVDGLSTPEISIL